MASRSSERGGAGVNLLPLEWIAFAVVLGMAALRVIAAKASLLSADEAYYWLWTRPLQLSYHDHPAMVAYWIKGGLALLGDNELGVRLGAVVGSVLVSALAWDTARIAFGSRRAAALAVVWLNCMVIFAAMGVVITPDSPLLLFWAATVWALVRVIRGDRVIWVFGAGLALGLGAISKYTMALLLPGILLTFALFPRLRVWWRRPVPYLAALLAAVVMSPLVIWNLQNGMASFVKQLHHAAAAVVSDPLRNLGVFVLSQAGLVTPALFLLCLWGMVWSLRAGWARRRPDWFLLGATSLPIIVYFSVHALDSVVQPHWAGPAYYSGILAAAGWYCSTPGGWRVAGGAAALGAVMTLSVLFQAATELLPVPPRLDPLRRLTGWRDLAREVDHERLTAPDAFIFAPDNETAGILAFYLSGHPMVFPETWRIRPSFNSAADIVALKGRTGLYVTRAARDHSDALASRFDRIEPVGRVELRLRDRPTDAYAIYLARGYRGGLFVQGDGPMGTMDAPCVRNGCP